MRHRQSSHDRPRAAGPAPARVPRLWLFTDPRADAALLSALRRLPPGSGVVFRHDALARGDRVRLWRRVRRIARARRLVLFVAGRPLPGAAGRHVRAHDPVPRGAAVTMPVHGKRDAARARVVRPAARFISPLFPTRSHPGGALIGRRGFQRLAQGPGLAIALGGMTARRFARMRADADGWAAIDAWSRPVRRAPG